MVLTSTSERSPLWARIRFTSKNKRKSPPRTFLLGIELKICPHATLSPAILPCHVRWLQLIFLTAYKTGYLLTDSLKLVAQESKRPGTIRNVEETVKDASDTYRTIKRELERWRNNNDSRSIVWMAGILILLNHSKIVVS